MEKNPSFVLARKKIPFIFLLQNPPMFLPEIYPTLFTVRRAKKPA